MLALAKRESRKQHRRIGVAPETKHPTYFRTIGLPIEEPMLRSLHRAGLDRPHAKILIQSFETGNLRRLSTQTDLPLEQLTSVTGTPFDLRASATSRPMRTGSARTRGASSHATWTAT